MESIDGLIESANDLFLKKRFLDAIPIYEKILKIDPTNLNAVNNKGYALSKSKDYKNAIDCYNHGLKINPNDKSLIINKISALRKMRMFDEALQNCDLFLNENPNELTVLYHKLRILQMIEQFDESVDICNKILNVYPNNGEILFDKAVNLACLGKTPACLKSLKMSIQISNEFKIKAKNSSSFDGLEKNHQFLEIIS